MLNYYTNNELLRNITKISHLNKKYILFCKVLNKMLQSQKCFICVDFAHFKVPENHALTWFCEIFVYTFTLYIYKAQNMREKKMTTCKDANSANKLYKAALANGLNMNSGIPKPVSSQNNSVFTSPRTCSAGGSGSLKTLAMVTGIAATGLSIFAATRAFSGTSSAYNPSGQTAGSQGGSAAVSAKSTISTLDNAATSNNAEVIKKAIAQGQADSGKISGQIGQTKQQVSTLQSDIEKIQGDYNNLDSQNNSLKGQLPEGKSSTDLIGDKSSLEADLASTPETIDDGKGGQTPNPKYKELKDKIKTKEEEIKKAKDIEQQIQQNEDKMAQLKQDKTTKENSLNDAKTKVDTLTNDQKSIDAKVQQLQTKLPEAEANDNRWSNTLTDGAIGAGVGALGGALVGGLVKGNVKGALIGGAIGAGAGLLAGGAYGYTTSNGPEVKPEDFTKQRAEFFNQTNSNNNKDLTQSIANMKKYAASHNLTSQQKEELDACIQIAQAKLGNNTET